MNKLLPKREGAIDKSFVRLAKAKGWLAIKVSTVGAYGNAGWPDRLVIDSCGHYCWIEFKRPGGKLTTLQAERHAQLISRHCKIFIAYDPHAAIALCESAFRNGKGTR